MSNVAFANQITAFHLHHQHPQQQTLTLKKHLFPALPIKSTRKHVHSNSTSTTKCIIEAFNSMKIEADFQNPVASGSFGDVFFGTLHPSNDPVVLKRSRPSKTARTLFSIEKKINQKLLTSKTEEIHSACQRWPVYLGDYVKDSEFFMVWKRDNDGQTLEDYLFSKPISHLYKIFNTTYSQSTNHQNSLRIPLFKNVLYNLLLALQDIHNLGIVHRDIKPSNLLITTSSDHNIKLIDFGSACQVSSILWSRGIDTLDPLWAPPETRLSLLAPKQFDVFSAALIGLTVLLPTLSNEMRLKEFRNILQTYNFDLRAYRTQWLNYKKSGNDADNDLAALFNQDDDRAKDVFYLLCAMLKNSPTERCSVEAALYSLSSLSS